MLGARPVLHNQPQVRRGAVAAVLLELPERVAARRIQQGWRRCCERRWITGQFGVVQAEEPWLRASDVEAIQKVVESGMGAITKVVGSPDKWMQQLSCPKLSQQLMQLWTPPHLAQPAEKRRRRPSGGGSKERGAAAAAAALRILASLDSHINPRVWRLQTRARGPSGPKGRPAAPRIDST